MKNTIFCLISLMLMACEEENYRSSCEKTCDNESISKIYNSSLGLVREIIVRSNSEGVFSDTIFVIQDQGKDILVPCNILPEQFKKDSLIIKFSGYRMSCCNLLRWPGIRLGFGCKFEISRLEILNE